MCCDHAFVMVGNSARSVFTDPERGVLGQFRHQFFLLALIVHMHKAALLMPSDRLVQTVTRLNIDQPETVRRFRVEIRSLLEIFLRFTHRYWFHEVSDHVQARDVFHAFVTHLGTERLYAEIQEALQDMSAYLNSDLLRRQSMIFLRLTVVTIIGLIGTTATGFLGMNLIAAADQPLELKALLCRDVGCFRSAHTLHAGEVATNSGIPRRADQRTTVAASKGRGTTRYLAQRAMTVHPV